MTLEWSGPEQSSASCLGRFLGSLSRPQQCDHSSEVLCVYHIKIITLQHVCMRYVLLGHCFGVTRCRCLVFYSILKESQETETHVPTSLLWLFPLPLQELRRQPVCCKPAGGASRCRLLLGFRQEKECATWLVSHDFRCRPFQHRHFSLTKAPSQPLLSDPLFLGLYLIPPLVNKSPQGCLWAKPEFPFITWKIVFPLHLIFSYTLVFFL